MKVYKRKGSPYYYATGYDTFGKRWRESTEQLSYKDAQAIGRELERKHGAATSNLGARQTTLADALVVLEEAALLAGRSEAQLEINHTKGNHLRRILGPTFRLGQIDAPALRRYAVKRKAEGVKAHTVYKELGTLRKAARLSGLKWDEEWMPELGEVYVARERYLTHDEFKALHSILTPKRQAFLMTYCYTGMRRGELHRLDGLDINLAKNKVFIRGHKGEAAARDRWVPIAPDLRPVLERKAQLRQPFPVWTNDLRDLALACETVGIVPVTPNDLRRTFASWLMQAGVPLKEIAGMMGHTTTTMLDKVYARLGLDDKAHIAERLPRLGI